MRGGDRGREGYREGGIYIQINVDIVGKVLVGVIIEIYWQNVWILCLDFMLSLECGGQGGIKIGRFILWIVCVEKFLLYEYNNLN